MILIGRGLDHIIDESQYRRNNRIIISNSRRLLTNYYKYVVVNVLKVHSTITGDFSKGVTPVLIPNTEVKTFSAEDTCLETSRKSRSLPVFPK